MGDIETLLEQNELTNPVFATLSFEELVRVTAYSHTLQIPRRQLNDHPQLRHTFDHLYTLVMAGQDLPCGILEQFQFMSGPWDALDNIYPLCETVEDFKDVQKAFATLFPAAIRAQTGKAHLLPEERNRAIFETKQDFIEYIKEAVSFAETHILKNLNFASLSAQLRPNFPMYDAAQIVAQAIPLLEKKDLHAESVLESFATIAQAYTTPKQAIEGIHWLSDFMKEHDLPKKYKEYENHDFTIRYYSLFEILRQTKKKPINQQEVENRLNKLTQFYKDIFAKNNNSMGRDVSSFNHIVLDMVEKFGGAIKTEKQFNQLMMRMNHFIQAYSVDEIRDAHFNLSMPGTRRNDGIQHFNRAMAYLNLFERALDLKIGHYTVMQAVEHHSNKKASDIQQFGNALLDYIKRQHFETGEYGHPLKNFKQLLKETQHWYSSIAEQSKNFESIAALEDIFVNANLLDKDKYGNRSSDISLFFAKSRDKKDLIKNVRLFRKITTPLIKKNQWRKHYIISEFYSSIAQKLPQESMNQFLSDCKRCVDYIQQWQEHDTKDIFSRVIFSIDDYFRENMQFFDHFMQVKPKVYLDETLKLLAKTPKNKPFEAYTQNDFIRQYNICEEIVKHAKKRRYNLEKLDFGDHGNVKDENINTAQREILICIEHNLIPTDYIISKLRYVAGNKIHKFVDKIHKRKKQIVESKTFDKESDFDIYVLYSHMRQYYKDRYDRNPEVKRLKRAIDELSYHGHVSSYDYSSSIVSLLKKYQRADWKNDQWGSKW